MIEYLEQQVFTRVKTQFSANVKSRYPNLDFTLDSQRTNNKANFPLVYMFLMPSPENSQDLDGTHINGITASFQIEVSDNESQSRARAVMNEVVKIMKRMMFDAITLPYPSDYDGVYRVVARFRRNIDENDVL